MRFLSLLGAAALALPVAALALIALAGWLTNSAAGTELSARTLSRFGFAAADTPS